MPHAVLRLDLLEMALRGKKISFEKFESLHRQLICCGMRTVFHLFVVKSNIAVKILLGKGVIITLLDLIKFFDKQSLTDACDSLHKANVNSKFFRVWYKLNARTEIEVRTGAGVSVRGLAGPVTGQGGGGAALASALNLDLGVERYFKDSIDEDCYGTI